MENFEAIKSFEQKDNLNPKHRKDDYFYRQIEAIDTEGNEILTLRTYHTGKRVYACLWLSINFDDGEVIENVRVPIGVGFFRPDASV